jgi:hypothetical protein
MLPKIPDTGIYRSGAWLSRVEYSGVYSDEFNIALTRSAPHRVVSGDLLLEPMASSVTTGCGLFLASIDIFQDSFAHCLYQI